MLVSLLTLCISLLPLSVMSLRVPVLSKWRCSARSWQGPSLVIKQQGGSVSSSQSSLAMASANELGISGPNDGKNKEEKLYEFGSANEELDEDALFEREMAREMFDMLRGEDEDLSIDKFFEWDDIKDVIELGVIDPETMALIIEAVQGKNPVTDTLSFEQWLEAVELVNQVQLTLENVEEGTESWDPAAEQEKMDELYGDQPDPTSESVMQMLQAFGLKPNVDKKKEGEETK